jgi:serine/threonine protein kinase
MTQPDHATIDQPGRNNPHEQETVPPSGSAVALAAILDGYMAELQAGKVTDRDRLMAAHPELAAQIEACLAGIEFVHRATGPTALEPATLGEFRILRELGRGGMGVVYEAEQTSLRRRVALKVLRFGVGPDEASMERFRREAETVAGLHHTNIVPIFAIGSERGVHYYAMQLIAGRSLADVLEESLRNGKPLDVEEVTRCGLQAAEALAHAHQRGVIHRDIKPSNLLLDREGIVWLTDFGLAKRADEVTMTASGALMGTPRYMSPEQAESLQKTIDHRTDVYSLGASLYEMAAGRPVFESATPHGVLIQILTEEPVRPRQLRPDLPRDLETIILTCLAKDPAQRYQTALALAADLRAMLEGRPIQARRVSVVERVARYVRKRRNELSRVAMIVAATTLLIVGSYQGWRFYNDLQLGRVVLTTDGPPLTAQVLAESSDEAIGEPFDIGTRTMRRFPAGDRRLRVTGRGLLGQTYRFTVNEGESKRYAISLDTNRLLGQDPIPYRLASDALVLAGGKADFVEWTGQTLIRRSGSTGKPMWDASQPAKRWEPQRDPVAWMRHLSSFGDPQRPGVLVQPAPDLNGDGTRDIIWAIEGRVSFLAISGADGSLIWTFTADLDGPGGPDRDGPALPGPAEPRPLLGRFLGKPAVSDIDGDGTPDLIAMFALYPDYTKAREIHAMMEEEGRVKIVDPLQGRRGVVAISGRSGRWLWNYALDPAFTNLISQRLDKGATVVHGRSGAQVAVTDGSRWIRLDLATGKPRGQSIDLGFEPIQPIQCADLDGDGEPDVLALGRGDGALVQTLAAFSSATGKPLWIESVKSAYRYRGWTHEAEWPLVADLDGDGRGEVVIPDTGPLVRSGGYRGLRILDGASGQTRWVRPMRPDTDAPDGLARLIVGPDLDSDGTHDLVAVSHFAGRRGYARSPLEESPQHVYVDAISGTDGHSLWWWSADLDGLSRTPMIGPPRWWGRGPDGWPLLIVPVGGKPPTVNDPVEPDWETEPPVVHFLAAATGHEVHTLAGLSWPRAADLDGDGLEDLWGSYQGKLRAFRGELPEAWRALGQFHAGGDLDGDGIADLVSADLRIRVGFNEVRQVPPTAIVRSGRDGRVLWRTAIESWQTRSFELGNDNESGYTLSTFPLPCGDFDGDGVLDVVATGNRAVNTVAGVAAALPLEVYSGRMRRLLWSAGPLPLGFEASGYSSIRSIDVRACDRSGPPDLLVLHLSPFAPPRLVLPSTSYQQTRLARVSARDGRVVWDIPLAESNTKTLSPVREFPRAFGDLNGDGILDAVWLIQVDANSFEWRAVSLRDGTRLWSKPSRFPPSPFPTFAVGDLDRDGRAEVVVEGAPPQGKEAGAVVAALNGHDGTVRWTWRGSDDFAQPSAQAFPLCLVDFEGSGRRAVCLNIGLRDGSRRVVILDAQGQVRTRRDLTPAGSMTLEAGDLDGDGCEELLFEYDGKLRASRGDLEDLWSWPTNESVREIIPAQSGQPAIVVLDSMVGLDGATGRPRWFGRGSTALLDPVDSTRLPNLLSESGDATICRMALPTTPEGSIQPARGAPIARRLTPADPRWIRPLPWNEPSMMGGSAGLGVLLLLLGGIAFVAFIVPLAILRLATRRRVWGTRLLLALPVVVAIPLALLMVVKSNESVQVFSWSEAIMALTVITFAGLPVPVYAGMFGSAIFRRQWSRFAWLAGLTALAALVIGIGWWWSDVRGMPATERYTWSGWWMVLIPGAYVVGTLALLRDFVRFVTRLFRRKATVTLASSTF